jgi:pimeloyl-ACP methyl ester carboxylesterase
MLSCDGLAVRRYVAKPRALRNFEIMLFAPAAGLCENLDSSFSFMAETLAVRGLTATVVCFAGQRDVVGEFSVAKSCRDAHAFVAKTTAPQLLFGVCTGALSALAAARGNTNVRGVFAWDLAPRFDYCEANIRHLETRFGVRFCSATAYEPIQAESLAPHVEAPVVFAYPRRSYYARPAEQKCLAESAPFGKWTVIPGVGHFPGIPAGSDRLLAEVLSNWALEAEKADGVASQPAS